MFVNQATKEINLKLIYVGPNEAGKTENLRLLYGKLPADSKGKLVTVQSPGGDTTFFDMVPPGLAEIRGFKVRVHLYALGGEHEQPVATRLLLKGADGLVFVADAHRERSAANGAALELVKEMIAAQGRAFTDLPRIVQLNKLGSGDVTLDEVKVALELGAEAVIAADTHDGSGVFETLKAAVGELLLGLKENRVAEWQPTAEEREVSNWNLARVRVVSHACEFLGEGAYEFGPFAPQSGGPPFYVMLHPATSARPYVTYCTFGLSTRPQPAGGPDPRLELLAHAPAESDEVAEWLVRVAMMIASSGPDDAAFKTFDTIDFEDPAPDRRFVLVPPDEEPPFGQFPDSTRTETDLMFTQAVGAASDADARVTFLKLLPLTSDELAVANREGSQALLPRFRGRPKSFGWGRAAEHSVLRGAPN